MRASGQDVTTSERDGGGKAEARILPLAHGLFWIGGGLWPVFHRQSFEGVTGPKVDFWLVKTVGSLLAVMGFGLVLSGSRGKVSRETAVMAAGGAAALVAIDAVYVTRGRISRVYLLDGLAHIAFALAWLPQIFARRSKVRS